MNYVEAIVSNGSSITSIQVIDSGIGYSEAPEVSIGLPNLVSIASSLLIRAEAVANINSSGQITSIDITNAGYGYTNTDLPIVQVAPPAIFYEKINRVTYSGDFGWITGIGTTSTDNSDKNFIFELYIPENSYLRDSTYGSAIEKSTIQRGYYFKISNSNIGSSLSGIGGLDIYDQSVISIGSSYIDGVYQVDSVGYATTEVPGLSVGLGRTEIVRVVVPVSNYNGLDVASGGTVGTIGGSPNYIYGEYIGDFSWGLMSELRRSTPKEFNFYINGNTGFSTSASVIRENRLKSLGYTQNF